MTACCQLLLINIFQDALKELISNTYMQKLHKFKVLKKYGLLEDNDPTQS